MQTRLDFVEDELRAAKVVAAGIVVPELLRAALTRRNGGEQVVYRNGFPQIATSGPIITVEMIEAMLDEDC